MTVILAFKAEWCAPCSAMEPTIEKLEIDYDVERIDVDQEQELAKEYNITSIPTLVIVHEGEELQRFVGATDYDTIVAQLA